MYLKYSFLLSSNSCKDKGLYYGKVPMCKFYKLFTLKTISWIKSKDFGRTNNSLANYSNENQWE